MGRAHGDWLPFAAPPIARAKAIITHRLSRAEPPAKGSGLLVCTPPHSRRQSRPIDGTGEQNCQPGDLSSQIRDAGLDDYLSKNLNTASLKTLGFSILTIWPAPPTATFVEPLISFDSFSTVAFTWGTSRSPMIRSVGTLISTRRARRRAASAIAAKWGSPASNEHSRERSFEVGALAGPAPSREP